MNADTYCTDCGRDGCTRLTCIDCGRWNRPAGHRLGAVEPRQATEPGALEHFAVTCSCGLTLRSSIASLAAKDAAEHVSWMVRHGG